MAKKNGGGVAVAKAPVKKATQKTTRPPKPETFSWVVPCLASKDPAAAIKFYTKALGLVCREQIPGPDGRIMHAELTYHDQVIMLGLDSKECPNYEEGKRGLGTCMYLYHENVDQLAKKAKAAGATIKQDVTDQFWGDRTVLITDPDGYQWMFATNVGECNMDHCNH